MKKDKAVRPLGQTVLVKKLSQEQSSPILLPESSQIYERGEVVRLSDYLLSSAPAHKLPIAVGDVVWFFRDSQNPVSLNSDQVLVPFQKIVAVEERTSSPIIDDTCSFFRLDKWPSFVEKLDIGKKDLWKRWENIRIFTCNIGFLEPFLNFQPLEEALHEHCVATLSPYLRDSLDPFKFERGTTEYTSADDPVTMFKCVDDLYEGALILSPKRNRLIFRKHQATIENCVETLPIWMKAIHSILESSAFGSIAGSDYSRVLFVEFKIEQVIRLEGEGFESSSIQNSDLMGHFLRFGLKDEMSPTIKNLGLESPLSKTIGRVDVKFSFNRKIGPEDHQFLVWLDIQAPCNDKSRTLHLSWDLQDIRPKRLTEMNYGIVFENFFRDTVLCQFYPSWFKNINCSSLY